MGCCSLDTSEYGFGIHHATRRRLTGHLQIHGYSPVRGAFRRVDIQVAQLDFAYGLDNTVGLLVSRHANLFATLRRVERVDVFEMVVVQRRRRRCRAHFEVIEKGVEVFVLMLEGRYST